MEVLVLIAVLSLLGALAAAFGADSRSSDSGDWDPSASSGTGF